MIVVGTALEKQPGLVKDFCALREEQWIIYSWLFKGSNGSSGTQHMI